MRIDSAILSNAIITASSDAPLVSGSAQVNITQTTGYSTFSSSIQTYTNAKVAALVDSSPGALDTLNELAAALGDDANISASIHTSIGNRLTTAAHTSFSSSNASAYRAEISGLSGSAHTQRVAISGALDATIDALDTLGISTDTERGALSGSAHTQRNALIALQLTSASVGGTINDSKVKLAGIESGATADQTNDEIKAAVEAASDSNTFTDADHSKLNAIEASATADQSASEILTLIKTVDGAGSGLDADTLDGNSSAYFAPSASMAAFVNSKVAGVVDSSPAALDTLNELAAALGDDANFATTTATSIGTKLAKASNLSDLANAGTARTNLGVDAAGTVNYVLPTNFSGDDFSVDTGALTGATVVSDIDINISTDTSGRVTDANGSIGTRTLTLANLGYTGATDANNITNNNQLTNGAGYITSFTNTVDMGDGFKIANSAGTDQFTVTENEEIRFAGSGATSVSFDSSTQKVTISSTDNNTTYSVGDGGLTQNNFTNTLKSKLDGIAASATNVTNNNQITNGAGYTTNVGDITSVTAGTGMSGGGTSGAVTLNCSITNNNQLTNGAGYITSYTDTNTTYSAGNGLSLSGTTFLMSGAYTGNFTATGDITAYSDESLKKDVKTIEGALDKTKELRGVEFTRIADDTRSIGVIAQELENVLPELVLTDDEGIKSVNYAQITGLLIEAVKELSAKVDECCK